MYGYCLNFLNDCFYDAHVKDVVSTIDLRQSHIIYNIPTSNLRPCPDDPNVTPAVRETIHLVLHWIMPPALPCPLLACRGDRVNPPEIVCWARSVCPP